MAKRGHSATMQVLLNGRLVGALHLTGSGEHIYCLFREPRSFPPYWYPSRSCFSSQSPHACII